MSDIKRDIDIGTDTINMIENKCSICFYVEKHYTCLISFGDLLL